MTLIRKGFSQRQFSSHVGMSENYFNQIINHKKSPSPHVARNIANQLELTFDDVFQINN
ncbi:helix-turn-helix transcriptional regulator [Lentibacillus cibarius]|uniref:Helix-turn-helix transcriptional regulator n=2 Tax=Lentibacillus cibarius TaxID=2583219 RepID=A0A5S3QPA7_9BACI|nr:helix-turn-helix transcriptional regulator [Lentibacillus cibarius]